MDIESIVKEWRARAEKGRELRKKYPEAEISATATYVFDACADQLESYATSQREMREKLEKLRELSEKVWLKADMEVEVAFNVINDNGSYADFCTSIRHRGIGTIQVRQRLTSGTYGEHFSKDVTKLFVECVNYVRSAILEGKG